MTKSKSPLIFLLGACSLAAAGAIFMAGPSAADADSQPILAELFTSQGCSSCPEADLIWSDLQKRNDVVALSFSIDYWDYIGWKDTLARHENTLRQQAYAKDMPSRQVYTPQVIVDGVVDVVGNERDKLVSAIDRRVATSRGKRLPVQLSVSGNVVHARIGAGAAGESATIWVAHTAAVKTVKVMRGENSGKVMTYTNVVRDFSPAGTWSGAAVAIDLPARSQASADADGVAVWVQSGQHGRVLGAAQVKLAAPLQGQ
jgi:hypothetical protein